MKSAELKNRLVRHRCMNCGFLGTVAKPDSSRALADLGEATEEHRQQWRGKLRTAREAGKLGESEYDPTMGFDLGIDSGAPFGVMCALGRPEGPRTAFHVPGWDETQDDFMKHRSEGFIIREADPPSRSPFGRVIGVAQIFVWQLVRPHACWEFMTYRAGLTPAEHVATREGTRRWRRDAIVGFAGVVLGALLKWWLGG